MKMSAQILLRRSRSRRGTKRGNTWAAISAAVSLKGKTMQFATNSPILRLGSSQGCLRPPFLTISSSIPCNASKTVKATPLGRGECRRKCLAEVSWTRSGHTRCSVLHVRPGTVYLRQPSRRRFSKAFVPHLPSPPLAARSLSRAVLIPLHENPV